MKSLWNQSGSLASGIIKSSFSIVLCLLLSTGCRSNKTIFNSAPLAPLINSRYSARNSVKTLISFEKEGLINSREYIQGRHLYNRAASRVNGLITHIIISVQANSKFGDSDYFQEQVIKTFESSVAFQQYIESLPKDRVRPRNPVSRGGGNITKPLIAFDSINTNAILTAIKEAAKAARKANSQQRAIIVCELKSLLLPDFDTIKSNADVENFPDPKCAEWVEKKNFPEPNQTPNSNP